MQEQINRNRNQEQNSRNREEEASADQQGRKGAQERRTGKAHRKGAQERNHWEVESARLFAETLPSGARFQRLPFRGKYRYGINRMYRTSRIRRIHSDHMMQQPETYDKMRFHLLGSVSEISEYRLCLRLVRILSAVSTAAGSLLHTVGSDQIPPSSYAKAVRSQNLSGTET